MPNLSLEATHAFWHEYPDPIIYKVVAFMEGVEEWTLDGNPELEAAMLKLGEALDDVGGIDLQKEDEFIRLAAYLKASRNLRLLQSLDIAHPGAASKLLMYAERVSISPNDTPGLFLRRNVVFERLRLLSRIFAPERFALISKVLEDKE